MSDTVETAFRALAAEREGCRNIVYRDTLGKPTVGIGHLVVPADHLAVGDVVSATRIDALFAVDSSGAMIAAREQAGEAGITSDAFLPYLASVNFQLGTHWTQTFPATWKLIVTGDYEAAAAALDGTLWQHETPVRVADFQKALRDLAKPKD